MKWYGPDSLESWRICATCALTTCFASAGMRSAGFIYVAIQNTYSVSRKEASWPIMLLGAALNFSGLFSGPLTQRYGAKAVVMAGGAIAATGILLSYFATSLSVLTITLGIIHGTGSGMVFVMNTIFINEYFDKYRGFALGINYAGSTSVGFIFPKFLEYVTGKYGFHGGLLLFGAILINSVVLSSTLKKPSWKRAAKVLEITQKDQINTDDYKTTPFKIETSSTNTIKRNSIKITSVDKCTDNTTETKNSTKPQSNKEVSKLRESLTVFKVPVFYLLMTSYICFNMSFEAFISLVVDFSIDRGADPSTAVGLISLCAFPDLISRLTIPALAQKAIKRRTVMMWNFVAMAILNVALSFTTTYTQVAVIYMIDAVFIGSTAVIFSAVTMDYVGFSRLPLAYGLVNGVAGITACTKPFVIGYYRDYVGTYSPLYRWCGVLAAFAAFWWIVVIIYEWKNDQRSDIATCTLKNVAIISDSSAPPKNNC